MPSRIFSRAARARRSARACVTLRQKIFIAFLDELGNFKHFETYFFLAIFGPKNRQFGDLAPARSPDWQKIANLAGKKSIAQNA